MYGQLVSITIRCPVLKRDVVSDSATIEGGCQGHYEDEYCYCDSAHLEVKCECTGKKGKAQYHYISIY